MCSLYCNVTFDFRISYIVMKIFFYFFYTYGISGSWNKTVFSALRFDDNSTLFVWFLLKSFGISGYIY